MKQTNKSLSTLIHTLFWHIKPWTNVIRFADDIIRHIDRKNSYWDSHFTEVWWEGSNWQKVNICLKDCLALNMMTSSNGNIFFVSGSLYGWIPLTEASDAELWCFLWPAPEQRGEQAIEMLVIWDTIVLIMTSTSGSPYSKQWGLVPPRRNG